MAMNLNNESFYSKPKVHAANVMHGSFGSRVQMTGPKGRLVNGPAPKMYQAPTKATMLNPTTLLQQEKVQVRGQKKIRMPKPVNTELPPCNTIYVNNLNEKIKPEDLKKALRAVFHQFGKICDIIAMKSMKRKGQAYISFEDIENAKAAVTAMQGFPLFQKPLRIEFARTNSDKIAKKRDEYTPRPPKPPKPSRQQRRKIHIENERARLSKIEQERFNNPLTAPIQPIFQFGDAAPPPPPPTSGGRAATMAPVQNSNLGIPPPPPSKNLPPNKILFIERLPPESNELMISVLFNQFVGYKEVRLVPGRADIAFVEFETIEQSTIAKNQLNNFKVTPTHALKITFAKQ